MKIDYDELFVQRRQEIIDSGKYVMAEVIVPVVEEKDGKIYSQPILTLTGEGDESAFFVLLRALKKIEREIYEQDPELLLMMMQCDSGDNSNVKEKIIDVSELKDKEIEEDE